MKRVVLGLAALVFATAALALGLSVARPDLVPAWARIAGSPAPAQGKTEDGLYCDEHGVPEKFCTLCHEELKGKLLLCPEHGNIPEDICTKCHPEVEKAHDIRMCPKGHGLPEHFCVDCGKVTSDAKSPPDDGWCALHNTPEELCEACADPERAKAPGSVCLQPLPLVRLADGLLGRRIGLETARAVSETHAHVLEANAETAFDANQYAEVRPRVTGFVREVKVDLGQVVQAGDLLAVVDSPDVSGAKSRLISARAALALAEVNHDRTRTLARQGALPAKQELETKTTLNQADSSALDAAQTLRNLGFDDIRLEAIVTNRETSGALPIVATIDGTVVQRHAVLGEAVQPTSALFAVANTAKTWLWIDVYEAEMDRVQPGQKVAFTVTGAGKDANMYEGIITWVGAQVDETTRTTRVRAELANTQGSLRASQFGKAVIQVGDPHEVVVIPRAAVQTKDGTEVVFLPEGEGVYRPRRVLAKPSSRREVVEVSWGLKPGDRVVTRGSFWLKTEIMKGAIGAGCCD